jgi:hypothetical protein
VDGRSSVIVATAAWTDGGRARRSSVIVRRSSPSLRERTAGTRENGGHARRSSPSLRERTTRRGTSEARRGASAARRRRARATELTGASVARRRRTSAMELAGASAARRGGAGHDCGGIGNGLGQAGREREGGGRDARFSENIFVGLSAADENIAQSMNYFRRPG